MPYPRVGRVRFETMTGSPIESQHCALHVGLRPYQLLFRGLMYVQNRQEVDGWVYRAAHEVTAVGHTLSDPSLEPIDE